jgi:hypothetical protein
MIIKMENVWETGDGRPTDRPLLLYDQFVSRRPGTSQKKLKIGHIMM